MKNISVLSGMLVAIFALSVIPSEGAQDTKDAIDSHAYLIGTWSCRHTVGTFSGNYVTRYEDVLGNRWLKQSYDFPATAEGPPIHAEYFIGYDERHQGWVRFGAHSNGQYFAIRMADDGRGGWKWKYVSFFPLKKPLGATPDAVFRKTSESRYSIDGPTYKRNGSGPTVTEHHICTKS